MTRTHFYFYFYSSLSSFLQWGETFELPRFISAASNYFHSQFLHRNYFGVHTKLFLFLIIFFIRRSNAELHFRDAHTRRAESRGQLLFARVKFVTPRSQLLCARINFITSHLPIVRRFTIFLISPRMFVVRCATILFACTPNTVVQRRDIASTVLKIMPPLSRPLQHGVKQ